MSKTYQCPSYARFTLADPMPRLGSDAVGGNSGRNHPTSRRHTIHIGRVACNASVGTRESYNIVRLPGWYGERVLFITTLSCVVHVRLPIGRCPMPDHPPCQIIPHPLAQSTSAPGSCKIFYDSLFSTLRLAALIEWETEIRQAGEAVLFYLENDENNALRFSHGFAVDFETLKYVRRYKSGQSSHNVV